MRGLPGLRRSCSGLLTAAAAGRSALQAQLRAVPPLVLRPLQESGPGRRGAPRAGTEPLLRYVRGRVLTVLGLWLLLSAAACSAAERPWPFDAPTAKQKQQEAAQALGVPVERTVELLAGQKLTLVLVPAGTFMMGSGPGESALDPDEGPAFLATIEHPLWVSKCEITNAQYRLFTPSHDSRNIDTYWKDRVGPGPSLNGENQPAVRLSWEAARRFCAWLSKSSGLHFRLPSEPEWEWSCRAGADSPWGCAQADLARYANFADASLKSLKPWALRDDTQNDRAAASADVGGYEPNAWGLCDMHGNVAEWCESVYRPYPLLGNPPAAPGAPRVVRGGSWDDRPRRVRSAFRLGYPPDYCVYNVGFRVVADTDTAR